MVFEGKNWRKNISCECIDETNGWLKMKVQRPVNLNSASYLMLRSYSKHKAESFVGC